MYNPRSLNRMDFNLWEHIKLAIDGLCPIIGTVNLNRRTTDVGDSSNAFKAIIARTAASAAVAVILGCAAGLLSAYIMVQVMQERLDHVDKRVSSVEIITNGRIDRLENRINRHLDVNKGND